MHAASLFSCDDQHYTPSHVLEAMAAWGDRKALEDHARARANTLAAAHAAGWEVEDQALQALSVAFRRERGLRSAEGTQAWMESRGVDVDDFGAFLERTACEQTFNAPSVAQADDVEITEEVLWTEAVFSGHADGWCLRLAQEVAAAAALVTAGSDAIPSAAEEDWYPPIAAAYARFEEDTLTDARLEQALRLRWQELFIIDCAHAEFETAAMAREASLCVREDGMSLEDVARDAVGTYTREQTLLCELPPEVRTLALCATEGAVLEPVVIDDQHTLYRIGAKSEPRLEDAPVRRAISATIMDQALRPLLQRHIQWNLSGDE